MDISRSSHDARKHFDATRALQGRLLTDDDLNVADIIAKEDRRLERVDVIGPAGSPDDGFKIGGPDTCARLRTMRRVRLLSNVNTGDCAPAMQLLAKTILSGALGPDFGLKTDAHLHVGLTAGQQKEDLCSPAATAGFLGAENQA